MEAATDTFAQWLAQAQISESAITIEQRSLLHAAFHFRQRQGSDYFRPGCSAIFSSTRAPASRLPRSLGYSI